MGGVATDREFWEQTQSLLPEFMEEEYETCEGWKCGAMARLVLRRFAEYAADKLNIPKSTISYHTFYNELRRLGYEVPVVKSFDQNTKVKGIRKKQEATWTA